jgi:hypothetical protein
VDLDFLKEAELRRPLVVQGVQSTYEMEDFYSLSEKWRKEILSFKFMDIKLYLSSDEFGMNLAVNKIKYLVNHIRIFPFTSISYGKSCVESKELKNRKYKEKFIFGLKEIGREIVEQQYELSF